jgi:predicted dienelactone hydrolase
MKAAASLALLATLTTACTMSRPARVATIASGAAIAVVGAAMTSTAGVDADNNGYNEDPLDDNWDAAFGGVALVGLGVLVVVAGAVAHDPPEAVIVDETSRRPSSVTWTPDVRPYNDVPGMAPGMTPRASLPEVATDDVVLRMAQQARAAVERGNCAAAWSTWDAMNARDERYAAAIAAGPVFAPCPRTTALTY